MNKYNRLMTFNLYDSINKRLVAIASHRIYLFTGIP